MFRSTLAGSSRAQQCFCGGVYSWLEGNVGIEGRVYPT